MEEERYWRQLSDSFSETTRFKMDQDWIIIIELSI
jgi:hypothetical protein